MGNKFMRWAVIDEFGTMYYKGGPLPRWSESGLYYSKSGANNIRNRLRKYWQHDVDRYKAIRASDPVYYDLLIKEYSALLEKKLEAREVEVEIR